MSPLRDMRRPGIDREAKARGDLLRAAATATAAALAALFLWTWAAGVGDLFGSTSRHVAMSPGTALGVLILSLSVLARDRHPTGRIAVGVGAFGTVFTVAVGLGTVAHHWLRSSGDGARSWLGISIESAGVLASLGILWGTRLCWPGSAPFSKAVRLLAATVLGLVTLISASRLTSSANPAEGQEDPMALWSAVAFGLLCLALIIPGSTRGSEERAVRRSDGRRLGADGTSLAVSASLALVIATLGCFYLRWEQARIRTRVRNVVHAIADLKATQIADWRRERFSDARFFSQAAFVRRDVEEFLANPDSARARAEMAHWMTLLKGGERYERVTFLDDQLVPRLSVPDGLLEPLSESRRELLDRVLRTGRIEFGGIRQDGAVQGFHIDIVFPVQGADGDRNPAGMVLLRLDPRQYLFPLLQSWPMPDQSGEMALVRLDGDSVVVLNPLRYLTRSVLSAMAPLAGLSGGLGLSERLVSGGLVDAVDYRGVPVLADLRALPDSPWFLISKLDRSEVYQPLRQQAWLTLLLTAVLAGTSGLAVRLFNKQRDARFARSELAAERDRRVLLERIDHLMRSANDAILLADAGSRIVEVNRRCSELFQYSAEELIGVPLSLLEVPSQPASTGAPDPSPVLDGPSIFEAEHRRKDGTLMPVEISRRFVTIGDERFELRLVRDIQRRKDYEREIERLNRLYATLSRINQMVLRQDCRADLLREACRVTAGCGGFALVWIAWPDHSKRCLHALASAGPAEKYLDRIEETLGGLPEGRGPVARCLRDRRPVIVDRLLEDPEIESWRALAEEQGLRSMAVLPIAFPSGEVGGLAVYSTEPGAFQDKEAALLGEIAGDLAFALEHVDREVHRRRMEEQLRRREELLEQTGQIAQVGGWEFDPATGSGTWTKEVARIHELDPETETNVALGLSYYRGESRDRMETALRRVVEEGIPFDLELEFVTPSGVMKWVRTIGRPVEEQGRVVRVWGAFQDITTIHRAMETIAHEASRRRLLFDEARDGIVIIDEQGKVAEANQSYADMLGYSLDEMHRLHVWDWDVRWTREEILAQIRHLDRSGDFFETRQKRKDGTFIDVEISSSAVTWAGRKLIHCQCRDLSERRQLEAQLLQAQKMEAIGLLAGGVAHDFNNILASMMMNLGLLGESPGLDAGVRSLVQELNTAADRAASLVRQLLMFSSRTVLQVKALDVNDVVENLLKMLRRLIGEHLRLEWHATSPLPCVMADAGMLEQVVMNLVVNARDAMPDGGTITLSTEAVNLDAVPSTLTGSPRSNRSGPHVRLTVADAGCGMSAEVLKNIFDPFFTTKEVGKGTGLGLATVYGITQQHRGWVEVESEVDKGSVFSVYFPASRDHAVTSSPSGTAPVRRGGGETIVLVEDDPAVRKSLTLLLRKLGYQIHAFANGPEALAAWDRLRDSVDLLLTDLVMPEGMTGIDLCRQLLRSKPDLRTIISSGYTPETAQADGLSPSDGVLFLPKPYDVDTLSGAIRAHLKAGT